MVHVRRGMGRRITNVGGSDLGKITADPMHVTKFSMKWRSFTVVVKIYERFSKPRRLWEIFASWPTESLKPQGKQAASKYLFWTVCYIGRYARSAVEYIVLIWIGGLQPLSLHVLHIPRRTRAVPTVFDDIVLYRSLAVAPTLYRAVGSLEKCIPTRNIALKTFNQEYGT